MAGLTPDDVAGGIPQEPQGASPKPMLSAEHLVDGDYRYFVRLPDGTETEIFDEHGNPLKIIL